MAVGELWASMDESIDFAARPVLRPFSLAFVWLILWIALVRKTCACHFFFSVLLLSLGFSIHLA
jgi:hypothetical protein